jgi:Uma2 family endonuclease
MPFPVSWNTNERSTAMVTTTTRWTLDALVQEWGYDVPFEVIDGEVRQVSPCSGDSSRVSANISTALGVFNEAHDLGELFVSEGGFILSRNALILVAPDIAFVRTENIPLDYDFQSFFPGPPDFATEVLSPTDRADDVIVKIEPYLAAGTRLVWKADPVLRLVEVFRPNHAPKSFYLGDTLDGGEVFPGLRLSVSSIFRAPRRGRSN